MDPSDGGFGYKFLKESWACKMTCWIKGDVQKCQNTNRQNPYAYGGRPK